MSIHSLKSPDPWTRATFEGRPACCFFCGKDITEIAIVWSGHAKTATSCGLIVCHPDCAVTLGMELIGDARNAQRILTGKPLLAGVHNSLLPQGEA